jgi:hypothetical protein
MFNIHGEWKLEVNNKVLIQWFSGSWNEEAIVAYVKDFRKTAAPLVGSDWAILSVFDVWELGVPEIEPHVVEHCQWFKDNGCIKDCNVYLPSEIKKMQLESMLPQTEGNYERLVFNGINKAINWLESCKFPLTSSNLLEALKQDLTLLNYK